jgi:hypothetical protein
VDATKFYKKTAFAYKQNRHKPILELKAAMENVLEHHFGRHNKCGPWCPTKKWAGNQEMLDKLCYRDKDKDSMVTYLQLRDIRDPFFTLETIKELSHPYDTNKCENIMKVITKFHPKDTEFYGTICGKRRIFAVITKDSIGLGTYVERILELMGV